MKLARFVWGNRKAFLLLILTFCIIGGYFAQHLPVAIFPQLTVPRIVIATDAGDLPIETTLIQVSRPLESAVSTIPGVNRVSSTTTRGSSDLEVTFTGGSDMQLALQRIQSQIAEVRSSLPADTNVTASVINPSIFPIMGYSLTSDTYDLATLRRLAIYSLRPSLARLPGVAQVRITGGDIPEYLVSVNPAALASRGLSLQDVQDALAKANGVSSVGNFDSSYQKYEIVVTGLLHGIDDIGNVTVASKGQVPVAISDIASVKETIRPPTVLSTGNGKPAVIINIIKQPDANTIQVAGEVRKTLVTLKHTLPSGVKNYLFYDQSEIVQQSEDSVVESIIIGGVLALIVLMFFLANLRAAGVVLLILPFTLLISFGLMKLMGETLNIMTLGALAIALGLVIDDGIVVVENIFHHIERGNTKREAINAGIQAITPAMIGSSLTTMAAFLPLTFLSGVTGQFFAPLALVMIAMLAVSLLLALMLTPILAEYMLRDNDESGNKTESKTVFNFFQHVFTRIVYRYGLILSWFLKRRVLVPILIIPLLIVSYLLFTHLKTGFFPEFDEGAFVIDYQMPAGTSLAETDRVCKTVEGILAQTPEVDSWSRLTGAMSGSGLELTEANQGDILVRLKSKHDRPSDEVMDDIRKQLEKSQPAFQVDIIQILQDGIGDIAGSPKPIEVKIYGDDTKTLVSLAHQTGDILNKIHGVVDENDGIVDTGPVMAVHVDSQRASRFGLSTNAVTTATATALRGSIATTVQKGEAGIDVRVQSALPMGKDKITHIDPAILPSVPIPTASGGNVPLNAIATLAEEPGSPQITRENQRQMVSVTARLEGRDLGSGMKEVQQRLQTLHLPEGYRIEYGGLYASQQQSFMELAIVLLSAVLLVSSLLVIQFRSFRQTFALLIAAILSLFGVLLGLWITGTPLNISSFTGAIMIVGIVTENGIVLFDFIKHLRNTSPDRSLADIVVEAGRKRLRPILMTTIGAILALLPLSLGIGAGAAMQKPLAIAVIGGLTISTLFTLIVAPVLYVMMDNSPRKSDMYNVIMEAEAVS